MIKTVYVLNDRILNTDECVILNTKLIDTVHLSFYAGLIYVATDVH